MLYYRSIQPKSSNDGLRVGRFILFTNDYYETVIPTLELLTNHHLVLYFEIVLGGCQILLASGGKLCRYLMISKVYKQILGFIIYPCDLRRLIVG